MSDLARIHFVGGDQTCWADGRLMDLMEFRNFIFARDGHRCLMCRGRRGLGGTLSHKLDRSKCGGGPLGAGFWDFNIDTLCGSGTQGCHGWRERHPDDALRAPGRWRIPGAVVRGVYVGPDDVFAAQYAEMMEALAA